MFDKLNDDCWPNILQYLHLEDHLALAQVSEHLHRNVRSHWRRLERAKISRNLMSNFEQQPQQLQEFIECASGSLQELIMQQVTLQLLQLLQACRFPKMRTLDCEMAHNELDGDDETLLLNQVFPQLTKLTLCSNTSGRHLWLWNQLLELRLICCENLNAETFDRIFSTLPLRKLELLYYGYNFNLGDRTTAICKCKTLEELIIDDHHMLGDFIRQLAQLPQLRRLAFYTRDYYEYLLCRVCERQAYKVQALLFNDALWSSNRIVQAIMSMPNLRRLALQEDDIETNDLYNICAKLSHLEELHLMKMRALPTATLLWDMVDVCPSLKVLNLSNTKLNKEFLELSKACFQRVLNKRKAPLKLYCHNTGSILSKEQIETTLKHPHLILTFNPCKLNVWSSRFIEVEFNPNAIPIRA